MKIPRPKLEPDRVKLVALLFGVLVVLGTAGAFAAVVSDGASTKSFTAMSFTPSPAPSETPTPTPVPTPLAQRAPADAWLLPNLASLPPEEPVIEITEDGVRLLRFASIIANTGIGPIETMPNDSIGCPAGERHASQIIYHDVDGDGRFDRTIDVETTSRPAGCMLDHPEHDHWHFDAAARYVLTEPGSDQPIVSADKVSFCWRDNREVESSAEEAYAHYYPEEDECGHGDVQGITPGWADVYSNRLADQHLSLPDDLPSGVYCLWNSADPFSLLIESDDSDNTAVVAVEIIGAEVRIVHNDDGCDDPSRASG